MHCTVGLKTCKFRLYTFSIFRSQRSCERFQNSPVYHLDECAVCHEGLSDRWRTESKHFLGNVDMCQRMYIQLYTCNSIDRLLKDMQNASFPASHHSPLNHLCLCGSHWFRQSLIPRNGKRQRHSHLHHLVPDEHKKQL